MELLITAHEVLPYANWSLENLLGNSFNAAKSIGGLLLALMGIIGVIWGGVLLLKKLMAGERDQTSVMKIIMLLVIGGAFAFGGTSLIFDVARGSETTIRDIGEGTILPMLTYLRL